MQIWVDAKAYPKTIKDILFLWVERIELIILVTNQYRQNQQLGYIKVFQGIFRRKYCR